MIQYLPHGKFRLSRRNPVCVIIFGLEQSRVYLLGKQLQMWRPFKVDRGSFFWYLARWGSSVLKKLSGEPFLPRDAMHGADYAVARCLSVRLSVTRWYSATVQPVHRWRQSFSCCWSPGLEQSATGGHISAITGHLSQASEDSSVHRVIFEHTTIVTD